MQMHLWVDCFCQVVNLLRLKLNGCTEGLTIQRQQEVGHKKNHQIRFTCSRDGDGLKSVKTEKEAE